MLFSITSLALLPAIISTTTGLHAVLGVTNRFVPGHIAIEEVCLSALSDLEYPGKGFRTLAWEFCMQEAS